MKLNIFQCCHTNNSNTNEREVILGDTEEEINAIGDNWSLDSDNQDSDNDYTKQQYKAKVRTLIQQLRHGGINIIWHINGQTKESVITLSPNYANLIIFCSLDHETVGVQFKLVSFKYIESRQASTSKVISLVGQYESLNNTQISNFDFSLADPGIATTNEFLVSVEVLRMILNLL